MEHAQIDFLKIVHNDLHLVEHTFCRVHGITPGHTSSIDEVKALHKAQEVIEDLVAKIKQQ